MTTEGWGATTVDKRFGPDALLGYPQESLAEYESSVLLNYSLTGRLAVVMCMNAEEALRGSGFDGDRIGAVHWDSDVSQMSIFGCEGPAVVGSTSRQVSEACRVLEAHLSPLSI